MRYLCVLMLCFVGFSMSAQDDDNLKYLLERLANSEEDSMRVNILDNLWGETVYSDPETAIKYAKDAIVLAKKIGFKKGYVKAYQRLGIAYSNISDYTKSNEAYDYAYNIYKTDDNKKLMGIILHNKAINFKDHSQYDSAFYYNKLAEMNFKAAGDTIRIGDIYGLNGSIYYEKGQHLLALQNTLKEAEIYKKTDTLRYADALRTIASIQNLNGTPELAIKTFKECIDIYKANNDNYFLAISYREIGEAFSTTNPAQIDSAAHYLNKSIQLSKEISTPSLESSALMFYGELLMKTENYSEAINIYQESIKIAETIGNNLNIASCTLGLAEISLKNKQYNQAIIYTKKALKFSEEQNMFENINEANLILYKAYKAKSDKTNALMYFEKYKQSSDSLYNIKKTNRISELQTIHETERKEAEIVLQDQEINGLNQKVQISNLRKTLYGIGMISFIVISGLIFFSFKQRIKKNKIAREKQEEIFKQEIAFKKKELTSQTLHLVQKSTFIQELKDNLEKIKNSPELFKVEFRRLVMLLKKQSAEDKDWEVFKSYFSEVHDNFDEKLLKINSDISEKEIRLASFLRMNLTTKEIASMQNVLPDSVTKSKYRLKKKFQLSKDDDLTQFLKTI